MRPAEKSQQVVAHLVFSGPLVRMADQIILLPGIFIQIVEHVALTRFVDRVY